MKSTEKLPDNYDKVFANLPKFPNEISKWVWLAAMIDAESSLEIAKSKKNTARGYQYIPRMGCASTTPILLMQMLKVCYPFGAVSSHHHQDHRSNFWKSTRKFSLSGNGLRKVLPHVLPYLVVKKRRAEILIEALSLLTPGIKKVETERRVTKLWLEIRKLNKRGKL